MKIVKTWFIVVIALVALGACAGQEPVESNESALLIPAQWPIWQSLGGGYVNSCADQCELVRGKPPCWCIKNLCNGDPDGQPCGPIGAICNVISGSHYEELTCELPPPPPSTWHLTRSATCYQFCGVNNCNCIVSCPAGTASGQPCSPSGATCEVLTNLSTGLVQQFTCSQ